ncbi:uncharacterized protein LOC130813165 [Amaranthus tricolor]|uniref:uncharacterized protein LOC130813165 n=1 Tax=Amaranthus tricolor TaxID=29722 RepID=UPI00258E0B66|nr:uncharacterized protein LOC130813165 [Amaranthus tricolor]
MGNSLRCCLACVLPCGALDLIRIVHLNGYVEEITRSVTAGEILQSYPNHVLSKPCSQGNYMVRKIMILSSDSELKRGSIYFLIPDSSLPSDHSKSKKSCGKNKIKGQKLKNHDLVDHDDHGLDKSKFSDDHNNNIAKNSKLLGLDLSTLENDHENNVVCETKSKSKSKSGKHQRRRSSRGKSGIWQPHLEIITEDL